MSYIFLAEATADHVFRTLPTLSDSAGNDELVDACLEMAAPIVELAWRYDHNSLEEPDEAVAPPEHQTESPSSVIASA